MNSTSRIVIAVLVLGALGGAVFWWRRQQSHPQPVTVAAPPVAPRPPSGPPPVPVVQEPALRHPIGGVSSQAPLPASGDQTDAFLKKSLIELVGRKAVLSFLITDAFAQRLVATVNNLATDDAAADLWPVQRTPGRLDTDSDRGATLITGKNFDRYAPFVRFVDAIDTKKAVALYVRAYPLFQKAYEDLGFPGRYFNDRVVEVIDHLLATPITAGPIKVKRIEVEGARPGSRSGALYVFEDPALERSSTGQKILLRVGYENASKLKAKLSEIRQAIGKVPEPKGAIK